MFKQFLIDLFAYNNYQLIHLSKLLKEFYAPLTLFNYFAQSHFYELILNFHKRSDHKKTKFN